MKQAETMIKWTYQVLVDIKEIWQGALRMRNQMLRDHKIMTFE